MRTDPEPLQFECPLCGHPLQIAPHDEDMCQHCGAELHVFADYDEANQYAERMKAQGESARFRQVHEEPFWVVGHKATPTDMAA